MGQAYSQYAPAEADEQQAAESASQPATTVNRTAAAAPPARARPGNSLRGAGAPERAPRHSRFSPYNLFSGARAQRHRQQQERQQQQQEQQQQEQSPASVVNLERMSIDLTEQADVDMGGTADTPSSSTSSWERTRVRMRAGNELLSRIVSRSVISSVAQELERRMREDSSALDYSMTPSDRIDLYFRVSTFIQSILESNTEDPAPPQQQQQQQQQSGSAEHSSAGQTAASPQSSSAPTSESQTANSTASSSDFMAETNFRMFLLPGAIDQALAAYEQEHQPHDSGASEQPAGSESEHAEQAEAGMETEHSEPVAETEHPEAAVETEHPEPGQSEPTAPRELNDDERRRAEQQRSREEKLERLRNIARAINDERRNVQFPVMMLGVRLNPELQQQTRAAIAELDEGTSSTSTSSTSLVVEDSSTDASNAQTPGASQPPASEAAEPNPAPVASPETMSPVESNHHGLLARMNTILPNLLDLITSLRRVHNAASRSSADAAPRDPAASAASTSTAHGGNSGSASSQPGIAVFIMIHHMHLGNPMILPLVTHALFPELASDSSSAVSLQQPGLSSASSLSGNNYDLFLEIANIVGQVTATTVTQDIVDKKLHVYSFEGKVLGSGEEGAAVARLVGGAEEVRLVSADRCPVCLEAFELGDMLR
ncbi:hypothetical protein IWW52_004314, partial [Coemansia sp. RSA 2704]